MAAAEIVAPLATSGLSASVAQTHGAKPEAALKPINTELAHCRAARWAYEIAAGR